MLCRRERSIPISRVHSCWLLLWYRSRFRPGSQGRVLDGRVELPGLEFLGCLLLTSILNASLLPSQDTAVSFSAGVGGG
jgi:hypothetical protein